MYNREWLNRVHETRQLIPKVRTLIEHVPIQHRPPLMQSFKVACGSFENALQDGRYCHTYSNDITALGALALELIEESERTDAPPAHAL